MKRFLQLTILFSAIVLLLLGVGEWAVRRMPTSYSSKDEYIRAHGADIATLILGSSHTYYGIKPDVYGDSTFNAANVSQTPEYDLQILKHYMHYMPNLRTVIMPVSYFTFRDPKLEDSSEWWRAVSYKTQMHLPVHGDFSPYNLEIYDFDGYRAKLTNVLLHKPSNRCDSLGFGLGFDISTRREGWEADGKAHAAHHTIAASARTEDVCGIIDSIAGLCAEHGIRLVLISTPTWHTYRENLDAAQLSEMRALTGAIAGKHTLSYYDLSACEEFGSSDFHDPDHLTDTGAEKFSRLLRETLSEQ